MLRPAIAVLSGLLLHAVLLVAVPASPAQAAPDYRPWGRAWMPDQQLKKGCRSYRFKYRVTAPSDHWSAEVFLKAPNGRTLAHKAFDSNHDRARGTARWTDICRVTTRPGKHRITMRVIYCERKDCRPQSVRKPVRPTSFRFTR